MSKRQWIMECEATNATITPTPPQTTRMTPMATMTELERTEIEWYKALQDAEWLAGSTADSAERNLARAYLTLLTERT